MLPGISYTTFLAGHESGAENGLYNHEVCISSDQYTPVMDDWIPTGEIANVGSNPVYDLRIPKKLGDILPFCPVGYSHNYLTNPMLVKAPNLDMTSRQSNMRYKWQAKNEQVINWILRLNSKR